MASVASNAINIVIGQPTAINANFTTHNQVASVHIPVMIAGSASPKNQRPATSQATAKVVKIITFVSCGFLLDRSETFVSTSLSFTNRSETIGINIDHIV